MSDVKKIVDALLSKDLKPGVYDVVVRHDSWCAKIRGKGECNCNPEVEEPAKIEEPDQTA